MAPRLYSDRPLPPGGGEVQLDPGAARHVQVLRLQPGDALTLFDGAGGEWSARVARIARREVHAELLAYHAVERELALRVTLAVGMPANERMDALVEKATELGAAAIQPLVTERSVLRLAGERAERKRAHWQAIAVAACEQCGRNRVPAVAPVRALRDWLAGDGAERSAVRLLLSTGDAAAFTLARVRGARGLLVLSGPEGGFGDDEQAAALAGGWEPVSLGARVLRADTAPLAALAALAMDAT
jgi:16S rRNA (uracil1498-N3)-methyltransferase